MSPSVRPNERETERVPGFITVRTLSKRLPEKCLLPFGDGNVIEHVIRRAQHFGIDPIVCTTVHPSDNVLERIATSENVKCFRGSSSNKLKRWADCAEHFDLRAFHTVDADDLFFDGHEMRRSFELLMEGPWDVVCPTLSSSSGGGSVGYSLSAAVVRRACNGLDDNSDTEMMWFHLEKILGLRMVVLPEDNAPPAPLRLTLDYQEDYWLLESVRRMIGNLAPRITVANLFRRNPELHLINWFRNEEWKSSQQSKKIQVGEIERKQTTT